MSHRPNCISILTFDERTITRLRVRPSTSGIDVVSFDIERNRPDLSLDLALKAFALTHQLANDDIYTALPRYEMTARIIELPSHDPAEIKSMIAFSAEEYVPFPVEELFINQCVLDMLPDGQSRVLAVFAHRDIIDAHLKTLRAADIEPVEILLSTVCLAAAAAAADIPQPFALVHLASGGLEAIVANQGRLEYGRAVSCTHDWNDPEVFGELADELAVEVRSTLSACRRESGISSVDQIYLSSEVTEPTIFSDALDRELGEACAPAAFIDSMIASGKEHLTTLPIVSLGAALIVQGQSKYKIDLLPESEWQARHFESTKKTVLKLAGLAAVILLALGAWYFQTVHQRLRYIEHLQDHVTQLEPRADDIMAKQEQLRILQKQVDQSGSALELLAGLCELYPDGVNMTHFSFIHDQEIIVRGRAKSRNDLQTFSQSLTEAGKSTIRQFARAQRAYETEVMERGEKVWEYTIQIPFDVPSDDAGAATEEQDDE